MENHKYYLEEYDAPYEEDGYAYRQVLILEEIDDKLFNVILPLNTVLNDGWKIVDRITDIECGCAIYTIKKLIIKGL